MKLIAFVAALVLMVSTVFADDAALSKLIKDNKCVMCHPVSGLKLESKGKAPDLSKLSKDAQDKAWFTGWMKKEIEKEGKKHKYTWKGTDADLGLLADGLIEVSSRK